MLGFRPELSSFSRAYTGKDGSRATVQFLKMSFMGHCNFEGSQNQHFQSILLLGRGLQKEYYVYALDNVDNSGRPLMQTAQFQKCISVSFLL